MNRFARLLALGLLVSAACPATAEPVPSQAAAGGKPLQIILLGDSTTEAGIPKKMAASEPQFEDAVRMLLAAHADLPPCDVHNEGLSGETIRRLLDTRYDKAVKNKPQADYIFIRYGINDRHRRENFVESFPQDFRELLARLRADHTRATLIPMTVIPYSTTDQHADINALIRRIAEDEKIPLFDIAPRYLAELEKNPDGLCYRRFPLAKIPDGLRGFAAPYVVAEGDEPMVVVLDNRLDGVFGHLPGWAGDRHPNLAGYNVIADETAKWLAPIIRAR